MSFVIWGLILEVKNYTDYENDVCGRIYQHLVVALVGLNVNGVAFRKIFILAA